MELPKQTNLLSGIPASATPFGLSASSTKRVQTIGSKLAANNSGKAYEAETLINTACVSNFFFAAIIPQPKTAQNGNSPEIFCVKQP